MLPRKRPSSLFIEENKNVTIHIIKPNVDAVSPSTASHGSPVDVASAPDSFLSSSISYTENQNHSSDSHRRSYDQPRASRMYTLFRQAIYTYPTTPHTTGSFPQFNIEDETNIPPRPRSV